MSPTRQFFAAVATVILLTAGAGAQAAQQQTPQMRVMTISTFKVPLGEDRQKIVEYMRKWMVEPARMNPNVLSYRVLQHMYGSDASEIAIVAEYDNWAAITAPCEPCQAWMEKSMPAEGTPQRKEVDAMLEVFLKYYSDHADQVYVASLDLTKLPKN